MTTESGYDAAYPPANPPAGAAVVLGYLGGNTPHVWTQAEWNSQPARYRVGIWVRSNPGGYNGTTEGNAAVAKWRSLGAPAGTLIALDLETAEDATYVNQFVAAVAADGFYSMDYGSVGFLFNNPPGSEGYWPAVPGAVSLYNHPNVAATQTAIGSSYDTDLLLASLPLWDTMTGRASVAAATNQEADMPLLVSVIPSGNNNPGIWLLSGGLYVGIPNPVDVTNLQAAGVAQAQIDYPLHQALVAGQTALQGASAASIQAAVTAGVQAGLAGANLTVQAGLTEAQTQAAVQAGVTAGLATLQLTETSTLTAVTG